MDKYLGCEVCHGKGIVAVPRQDITQEEVDAELAAMGAHRNRPPPPVTQYPSPEFNYAWRGEKAARKRRR